MRAALCLLFLTLAGCGYHLGIRADRPSSESVAIPLFENLTFEPLLEQRVHEIFKETFLTRGWKVVSDLDQASAILSGKLNRFERAPIALNLPGQAQEYRVKIGLTVSFIPKNEGTGRPREEEAAALKTEVEEGGEYIARPDTAEDRAAEDRAIREVARRLAERVSDLLSEKGAPSLSPQPATR